MFYLIQSYWWVYLLALLIGFVTGFWAWARRDMNVGHALDTTMNKTTGALGAVGGLAAGAAGSALNTAKTVAGGVADAAHGAVDATAGIVGAAGHAVADTAGSVVDATKAVAAGAAETAGAVGSTIAHTTGAVAGGMGAGAAAVGGAVAAGVSSLSGIAKPKIAAAVGAPDDLLQIKGIGPKLNELCHSLGITRFDQIAKWGPADIAEVDQHLGTFRGRVERDGWIEQAGLLASGNVAAFETKFGKLDSENK